MEGVIDFNKVLFADLHIHSKYSRACSKDLDIPNLVKWARIKGLNLLGTGDFTHPIWLDGIKKTLKEEEGIYYYIDEKGKFPFILTSEISLIYSKAGRGRSVHLVYLAPTLSVVDKINAWLDTRGRRDYDGRPIFGISCRDFVAKMEEIDSRIEVIPAHVWTPHFGVFGSKSGFDSLQEAFEDKTHLIHAIETGISSNPMMNWRIKDLDNMTIVSFSDAHSFWPHRIGREATIFRNPGGKISYDEILRQIRENDIIGTIETDPAYGKYHYDGHRNCNFSCSYEETKKLHGICPVCGKPMIVGVEYRVDELAKLGEASPACKKIFYSVLPLHEIISLAIGIGVNSKSCWSIYDKLIEKFGTEMNILLQISFDDLYAVTGNKLLCDLIIKNREGQIKVKPGYDGEYGVAILDEKDRIEKNKIEKEKISKDKVRKNGTGMNDKLSKVDVGEIKPITKKYDNSFNYKEEKQKKLF